MVQTKFEKEVEFFLLWCAQQGVARPNEYPDLLANFKEPKRNKMQAFMEYVIETGMLTPFAHVDYGEAFEVLQNCLEYTQAHGGVHVTKVQVGRSWKVGTINLTKTQLHNSFEDPHTDGTQSRCSRYTWYVAAGKNRYKIYDLCSADGTFEDIDQCTWHVSAFQKSTRNKIEKDIDNIMSYSLDYVKEDRVNDIASCIEKMSI